MLHCSGPGPMIISGSTGPERGACMAMMMSDSMTIETWLGKGVIEESLIEPPPAGKKLLRLCIQPIVLQQYRCGSV